MIVVPLGLEQWAVGFTWPITRQIERKQPLARFAIELVRQRTSPYVYMDRQERTALLDWALGG